MIKLFLILCLATLFINTINAQAADNQVRLSNGLQWLLSRRLPNNGWDNQNTGRAILALQLVRTNNGRWSEYGGVEAKLSVKQLENEVLAALAKDQRMVEFDDATLISYLGALNSTCHNLRDFYGVDLIRVLENRMANFDNLLQYSFGVLTMCLANQRIPDSYIGTILNQLRGLNRPNCLFCDETIASVVLAFSCIRNQKNKRDNIINQAIFNNVAKLKRSQRQDGGFGNTYATALILHALNAANSITPEERNKAHEYLYNEQKKESGSFVNVFIATVVLPALGNDNYVDISGSICPPKGILVPDVGEGMIFVRYRIEDGIKRAFNISGSVAVPEGTTAHQIMNSLALESPGSFQYIAEEIPGPFRQVVINELNGLKSNPQRRLFWNLYKKLPTTNTVRSKSGVAMAPVNNELLIIRYERS